MEKKVMIVDDEVHIRSLLEQTLEELEDDHDVELLSAVNGEEGLNLIREHRPQLVFLDVMMPKMSGYDVCRMIKKDPELQDTTIILLTAKGQEVDRKEGIQAGAFKYMTKPFDPDEILYTAMELLGLEE